MHISYKEEPYELFHKMLLSRVIKLLPRNYDNNQLKGQSLIKVQMTVNWCTCCTLEMGVC